MLETYYQLIDLKHLLKPEDEFMCIVASDNHLEMARTAIERSIKAADPKEICLLNLYENRYNYAGGSLEHTDAGYQTFRLWWLDMLIEEYRG